MNVLFFKTLLVIYLHSYHVLMEGERIVLPTAEQKIFPPIARSSLFSDGLMPFVAFFSLSYQNTERLIKRRINYFVKETTQHI